MQSLTQWDIADGVRLTCITTDLFQTSAFGAAFVMPLQQENAAYAILPALLYQGTRQYPDTDAFGTLLDELYGARIEPYVRKVGENLVLGFVADVVDAACVPDGSTLPMQVAELMGALMTDPALENGRFRTTELERERTNLADRIRALRNDPRSYAVRRAQEIMCEHELFGRCEYGTLEGVQSLDGEQVWQAYQHVLHHAKVELFYCGSCQVDSLIQAFRQALVLPQQSTRYEPEIDVCRTKCRVRTITEEMPVAQGKLTLGLRTGLTGADPDYPALLLFNIVLGGYTGSRLFCHVREKRSLCYYASSGLDKVKGLMLISSGIDNNKYHEALTEIQRQMEDLCHGGLTQEELERARRTASYIVRSMQDSPLSLERYWQTQAILGSTMTPEQLLKQIAQVERGQVMAVGRHIDLDLIYFMKGVGA